MEIHSYHGSVDPLWNFTAMICPSVGPLPAVLPDGPSCDIKPAFLLAMLHQHGRQGHGECGKPRPWRAYTAMENHSYEGSIDQLYGHEIGFGGCRDFRLCLDEGRGWVGG
jgi:hypothetical protein